jgi:hypothetical protein
MYHGYGRVHDSKAKHLERSLPAFLSGTIVRVAGAIYICICVCVCVCIYIYIYIYIYICVWLEAPCVVEVITTSRTCSYSTHWKLDQGAR